MREQPPSASEDVHSRGGKELVAGHGGGAITPGWRAAQGRATRCWRADGAPRSGASDGDRRADAARHRAAALDAPVWALEEGED